MRESWLAFANPALWRSLAKLLDVESGIIIADYLHLQFSEVKFHMYHGGTVDHAQDSSNPSVICEEEKDKH